MTMHIAKVIGIMIAACTVAFVVLSAVTIGAEHVVAYTIIAVEQGSQLLKLP